MAYSNPAADAVNFTVIHRPMRPQKLPIPTALTFLLGGAIRPPASPKIRIRSYESLNLSSSLWTSGVGHFAPLAPADNSGRESLTLAQLYQHSGREQRQLSSSVDAMGIENAATAASVITYPELAEWHTTVAVDSKGFAAGSAAKAIIRPAAVEVSWMPRRIDNRQTDRSWSVNLRDRPFDPRWDLVPPLQAQPSPMQLLFSLRDGVTPPADSIQFVVQLDSVERSIYPRNSNPAASSLGKCREVDDVGRGPWSRAGWYSHGGGLPLDDDSGGEIGELPPPVEPMEAPYHIMNSIACYAVNGSERVAIIPSAMGIKKLIENYAWEFTGTLIDKTAVNFLSADANGPKHIEVTINGWTWLFAVKSFKRTSSFADEQYSFTAYSRSYFLASEMVGTTTVTLGASIGAWQLVEQLLSPLGFTLERPNPAEWVQTPEWTLEAGSASWVSVPPMTIIADIAAAAGAVVTPHITEDKLIITPRYRVSPWNWSSAPDSAWSHLIPEVMIPTETSEAQHSPELERVLIAGTTHGVVTEVVRAGTAGSVSAADISDPLAQSVAVNSERGRNVLAESGAIVLMTGQLPLMPPGQAPGLLVPGQLVKVMREDGKVSRGLVLENAINPNGVASVWQNVSLEVHLGDN
jgi:hypothetical protein